jgi:hypothetical protein
MEKIQLEQQQNADGSITYSYTYNPDKEQTVLEQEELIAEITSAIGRALTGQLLESRDTAGEPLMVSGRRMTTKGREKKSTSRRMGASK